MDVKEYGPVPDQLDQFYARYLNRILDIHVHDAEYPLERGKVVPVTHFSCVVRCGHLDEGERRVFLNEAVDGMAAMLDMLTCYREQRIEREKRKADA